MSTVKPLSVSNQAAHRQDATVDRCVDVVLLFLCARAGPQIRGARASVLHATKPTTGMWYGGTRAWATCVMGPARQTRKALQNAPQLRTPPALARPMPALAEDNRSMQSAGEEIFYMSCSLINGDFPGPSEALGVGLVLGMRSVVGVMYGTHGTDMASPSAGILNLW